MNLTYEGLSPLQTPYNKKQLIYLNIFWLGFIIYATSYTFSKSGYLNYIVCQAFQSLGLVLVIVSAIFIIRFKFANTYLQTLFVLYSLWLLLTILRGFSFDYDFIKKMLFDANYGMMPYFAPLILLFPQKFSFYKKAFDVIIILAAFYILYDLAFIKDLLTSDDTKSSIGIVESSALLSIPACFMLLTFPYHSLKRKIFTLIVIMLTLLFAIIRARRGLIAICVTQIAFSYLLYLSNSKNKLLLLFASIVVFSIGTIYVSDIYLGKKNNIFSFLTERGTEDTRTNVELFFYADMKDKDWIIGKGIDGEYLCPDIDEDGSGYRYVIETGYLQMILTGGIIKLLLTLLIALPVVYRGIFRSKNTLSKAAGIWILLWALYLYPATTEAFTMYYLLLWISVGICYSKEIRNTPENSVKEFFST